MRWFTSDLHLGHTNVIGYCDRPFSSVDEMNNALIDGWNGTVGPDDEVWILGDLAMGRLDETLPLTARLVGRKHLVLGNHDRPFPARKQRRGELPPAGWADRYLADGDLVALHHGEVPLTLSDVAGGSGTGAADARPSRGAGGLPVRLCHFPYRGDSGERDRYVDQRPVDDGSWLLHGHVHEKWRQQGRMINVGVDAWAGRPVAENELVDLIAAGTADRPPLLWT